MQGPVALTSCAQCPYDATFKTVLAPSEERGEPPQIQQHCLRGFMFNCPVSSIDILNHLQGQQTTHQPKSNDFISLA